MDSRTQPKDVNLREVYNDSIDVASLLRRWKDSDGIAKLIPGLPASPAAKNYERLFTPCISAIYWINGRSFDRSQAIFTLTAHPLRQIMNGKQRDATEMWAKYAVTR
jgi:hypothetical protein